MRKKWEQDSKRLKELSKIKYKCKCSHTVTIPVFVDRNKCSYCGNFVYKDDRIRFKYKLAEAIIKLRRKEKEQL